MAITLRCLTLLLALAWAAPTLADDPSAGTANATDRDLEYEDRISELERTVRVLADELERTRADVTVPEEPELIARYGLGPAASKPVAFNPFTA